MKKHKKSNESTVVEYKLLRLPSDQREIEVTLNLYGKAGWSLAGTIGCLTVLSRVGEQLPPRRIVGRRRKWEEEPRIETDPLPDPSYESFQENQDL